MAMDTIFKSLEGISRVLLAANFKNFLKEMGSLVMFNNFKIYLGLRDRILRINSEYFNWECMYEVLLGAQKMVSYKSLYMLLTIVYTNFEFPLVSKPFSLEPNPC